MYAAEAGQKEGLAGREGGREGIRVGGRKRMREEEKGEGEREILWLQYASTDWASLPVLLLLINFSLQIRIRLHEALFRTRTSCFPPSSINAPRHDVATSSSAT